MTALLDIKNISVNYGAVRALDKLSLQVFSGELVALVGANGAGKTTLLKSIVGLLPVQEGIVYYAGHNITHNATYTHTANGLTLVPEGRGVFQQMTVMENLQMGAYCDMDTSRIKQGIENVFGLFPRLAERQDQLCGTLSGGEQQMVAIGRALMSRPKLLLLDEPSMGLAPLLVQKIFDVIKDIHEQGVSILLIEQNAHMALALADRAYVIEHGTIVLDGSAKELRNNPKVQEAYLGV